MRAARRVARGARVRGSMAEVFFSFFVFLWCCDERRRSLDVLDIMNCVSSWRAVMRCSCRPVDVKFEVLAGLRRLGWTV